MAFKYKEVATTIAAQLVQFSGGLVIIKLLSMELTKSDYAAYALLVSLLSFVSTLPFISLLQGYMRYVSIYNNRNQFQPFYIVTLKITLLIFLGYFSIACSVKIASLENTLWDEYFYFIVALILTEILKITYRGVENSLRNRSAFAKSIISELLVKIIILLLFYYYAAVDLNVVLVAFILGNVVSVVLVTRFELLTKWRTPNRFQTVVVKRIFIFSSPLIVWGLFGWSRDMSARWILDFYTTKEEVASFALMASIAIIGPSALQSVIGAYLVPVLYEKENHQKGYTKKVLHKLIPILLVGLVLTTVLLFFTKNWIVLIITDAKYIESAWMLPIMFFAYGLFAISMMSTYEIFAYKQTKLMLWPNVISGLLALLLGVVLTQFLGLQGMVLSFVVSYLSYAIITFRISWNFKPV